MRLRHDLSPGDGLPAPDLPAPELPGRFPGAYEPLALLGTGGMGEVWAAVHRISGREAAVKLMRGTHAAGSETRAKADWRFTQEIRALGTARAEGIVQLYEAGFLGDGSPWFAMELIDGDTLSEWAAMPGREDREMIAMVARIADAIAAAHGQNVAHRDLKPANIMVAADDGSPKILDFGIARFLGESDPWPTLTLPGGTPGTAAYLAPEHAAGARGDSRSDVYALGVILFEMLAGQHPHGDLGEHAHLAALATREPRRLRDARPGAPRDLEAILIKCLRRNPDHRYQSADALASDLRAYLGGGLIQARGATAGYQARRFWRRARLPAGIAAVAAAGIAMGWTLIPDPTPPARARVPASRIAQVAPGHGEVLHTKNPGFRWEDPDGASSFDLQVAAGAPDPANEVYLARGTAPGHAIPESSALPANTTYFWRIRPAGSPSAPWSGWQSFSIRTAPESWPDEMRPYHNTDHWPAAGPLQWGGVPQATHYELHLVRVNDRDREQLHDKIEGCEFRIPAADGLDGDRQYDWRIRAWNELGPGPWSGFNRFRTRLEPATPIYPADGEAGVPLGPVFRWHPTPGAGRHVVRLKQNGENLFGKETGLVRNRQDTFSLPDGMTLKPRTTYTWSIISYGPSKLIHGSEVTFTTGD